MLLRISNAPRDYGWGSQTLLAGLAGRAPSGRPEAEVWFGDHPADPSQVDDGTGRTLDAVVGTRLPYLLKLLAAAHPLSIQAHPSKAQAEVGFARENAAGVPVDAGHRNYRDGNHKPELIVALSETFTALVGLREPEATGRLLAALGDAPEVVALRERVAAADPALGELALWLLSADGAATVAALAAALRAAQSDEFAAELALARAVHAERPGDAGIAVALLMNLVTLRAGEGLFVPAGVLHAYVEGLGVEVMAASDNVLRGGLTPKHIDLTELGRVLDGTPGALPVLRAEALPGATGDVAVFATPVDDFELIRVNVSENLPGVLPAVGDEIVLAVAGEVRVVADPDVVTLCPAEALFSTAGRGDLRLEGDGEAYIARRARRTL